MYICKQQVASKPIYIVKLSIKQDCHKLLESLELFLEGD